MNWKGRSPYSCLEFHEWSRFVVTMSVGGTERGSSLTFPYNPGSNLPTMIRTAPTIVGITFPNTEVLGDGHSVHTYMSVADETNVGNSTMVPI
jgi:hypothetical protein